MNRPADRPKARPGAHSARAAGATDGATVVCIKWGTKFPPYYVNRLHAGVKRFMDRPFQIGRAHV